jgi:hypothetical protein
MVCEGLQPTSTVAVTVPLRGTGYTNIPKIPKEIWTRHGDDDAEAVAGRATSSAPMVVLNECVCST